MNIAPRSLSRALALGGALLLSTPLAAQRTRPELTLLPAPRSVIESEEAPLALSGPVGLLCEADELQAHASAFASTWRRRTGAAPVRGQAAPVVIELALEPALEGPEAYRLEVGEGVRLSASSAEGMARATATLLQLLRRDEAGWALPRVLIEDEPEADYRAVMVDVARRPHDVETLYAMVDLLYLYRVRYLHLHLCDDQAFTFPFAPVTDALENNREIALEDWRALAAYADARGVSLIPELDLPGHSSMLKRSGYLEDPTPENGLSDADVAHPVNYERIFAIVDAMRAVFTSSPYFHIGGDESGAGSALVPFLAAVNAHVRASEPPARLLVWEGFHGRPQELPATGEDRVIVHAWESAYNPPWNLLEAGYEVINSSWMPLYVVGGGSFRHPHVGGRKWSGRQIHDWSKDEFWHWQPGTPVFEDRGPEDAERGDGIWHAPPEQRERILGGQLLFWEQEQWTVLRDSWERVPALAERLWCGARAEGADYVSYRRRLDAVGESVRALVRPVRAEVRGAVDPRHSTRDDYVWVHAPVEVELGDASALGGEVRYTLDGSAPSADSALAVEPLRVTGTAELRAQLYVEGEATGAPLRARFDDRPARVWASWYALPRRALGVVPDFADNARWTPFRSELLPELRGPYRTAHPVGQRLEGSLRLTQEQAGEHVFRLQTRDGRARLWIDGVPVLGPSTPDETRLEVTLELGAGPHAIRVDHASGNISPVVIVAHKRPGDERFQNLSSLLSEIPRGTEPQTLDSLESEVELFANGLNDWTFLSREPTPLADVAQLGEDGVLRIAGRPQGYLATKRWYRDYELELEWRWPEGRGGNSGVLVHTTTPLLFYSWPRSLEVQLQSGGAGDFWTIGADVDLLVEDAPARRRAAVPGNLHSHRRIPGRVRGLERPLGEWNRMRVRCEGGEVVVAVNGVEVNRGLDCTIREGAIALQSEGAPIEFRNVRVRPLSLRLP